MRHWVTGLDRRCETRLDMSIGALAPIFATSIVVSLTGALSPGPLTTPAVREGVRRGFWAGPAPAAGHGAIEFALVVALGLNRVLDEGWRPRQDSNLQPPGPKPGALSN